LQRVTEQLEAMTDKGLLFRLKKRQTSLYGAIPFVHGLFEFQVKDLGVHLAELFEQYYEESFKQAFENSGGMFLRTVPVQASVDVGHNVAAYDDAVAMLKEKDLIVVTDCICRTQKKVVGDGCGKAMEACFMFGSMGQYYIDKGMGREVGVDEAIALLVRAQEDGLVTQPATTQNPAGIRTFARVVKHVLRAARWMLYRSMRKNWLKSIWIAALAAVYASQPAPRKPCGYNPRRTHIHRRSALPNRW